MKKIKTPLILLAFATTALCGLFFIKTSKQLEVLAEAPANYYSSVTDSMSGETLRSQLHSIINNSSVNQSYDWSRFEAADEDPDNPKNIITIYARTSLSKSDHVSGSNGWNREHSFPQSKMSGGDGAKSDNHVIFASDNKVNGKRSNYKLADHTGTKPNVYDYKGNLTPCIFVNNTFDPGDTVARGMVARSTFYCAAMYNYDVEDNIESIETALKWHLTYKVGDGDKRRNEVVYSNQHNRNPFVDHPSYACRIWGTSGSAKAICDQYNGWTDGDEPTPTKTLNSIAVSGTPTKKSYTAGEHFSTAGLTVTAYYSDSTNENVTSKVTVSPDPLTAGTTSVTLSYKYGNDTKTATVTGITVSSGEVVNYGTLENPLSVSEAKALIGKECSSSGSFTKQQIYCKAKVGSTITDYPNFYRKKIYVNDINSVTSTAVVESLNMTDSTYASLQEGYQIIFHGYGYNNNGTHQFKYKDSNNPTLDHILVQEVSINETTKNYNVGDTHALAVSYSPTAATLKEFTYKSSNSGVATVDSNKLVTFKAPGTVTITATEKQGASASITYTVSKAPVHVESVTASLPSSSYYVGDTANIQYSVSPDDADNQDVTFTSSNTSVATVDANGKVTFKAAGSVVFTVASKENSSIKDTISVTVSNKPVEDIPVQSVSLEVSQPRERYEIGDTVQLNATITPANATNKTLTYSSDNSSVASVDSNGLVTCNKAGAVTIKATANNGVFGEVTINVAADYVPVEKVTISMQETTFYVGQTGQAYCSVDPSNATNKKVRFESDDSSIVKVDSETGEIECLKEGSVYIFAISEDDNSKYGSIKVTVIARPNPVRISILDNPTKTVYKPNEEFDPTGLYVVADYLDGATAFISPDEYTISSPDMTTTGVKTVTITYKESFTASFNIIVTEEVISDLKIEKYPLKTHYFEHEDFNPLGIEVSVKVGDKTQDVSDLVTFEYDFTVNGKVTVWFKDLWQKINVTIEIGEMSDEHKAADFAYVVEDTLNDVTVENVTLTDWNVFEHYYNTLDDAAKKVLKEQVTDYSGGAVDAAEELSTTLKKCAENYDEIYLAHKDEGFTDFMARNPVSPKKDNKDKSDNTLLIVIGIGVGVIVLVVLIIVIAVSVSKKGKKKHA